MGKTYRNKPPGADDWADWIEERNSKSRPRRAERIRKGADGVFENSVSGSAIEGKFNKWDDFPASYGKRLANKDIRRYNKRVTKEQMKDMDDES